MLEKRQIIIFGASIVWGAWDEEKGGWFNRLAENISAWSSEGKRWLFNLSIPNDETSAQILGRVDNELAVRVWHASGEQVVIISLGINDSLFNNKTHEFRTSPKKFQENIQNILKITEKYADKVVLIGPTPVDDKKVDPCLWVENSSYNNKYIQRFSEIVRQIAGRRNIPFIDLHKDLLKDTYLETLNDGVHPNAKGHQIIFENVKDKLSEIDII